MSDTKSRLEAIVKDDELDADRDHRISQAVEFLLAGLRPEGVPLAELVEGVAGQCFSPSVLVEALSRLLYAGRVQMTEDRRLLPG